jgi:plastocyanin
VPLVASGTAFDRSTLTVLADRPFSLVFENRDGEPHNVSIAAAGGAPLYVGEVFAGPAAKVYPVPALPAGRYGFRCDVHAEMTGTLVSQ